VKPLRTLESVETKDGVLKLQTRGPGDFLLTIDGRVLMTSTARRSEEALGKAGCAPLKNHAQPSVLVGGLGMGFTLRAVLDKLPAAAKVTVAELNEVVARWCRGPMAELTDNALGDPRVTLALRDVMKVIGEAAHGGPANRYDAIIIDLYEGPGSETRRNDPLYGARACAEARQALRKGGVFAIWGEAFDEGYVKRLEKNGFAVRTERPGKGGLKHVIFIATAI
jgi:spermidine synthase